MKQLQNLLDTEIPALKSEIEQGLDPFAQYSGRKSDGPTALSAYCHKIKNIIADSGKPLPANLSWQTCSPADAAKPLERNIRWTVCHDDEAFYIIYTCKTTNVQNAKAASAQNLPGLILTLEPRRLWSCRDCYIWPQKAPIDWQGQSQPPLETNGSQTQEGLRGWIRIPFVQLDIDPKNPTPLRINIRPTSTDFLPWLPLHPWPHRLLLGSYNPADLGWVLFEKEQTP